MLADLAPALGGSAKSGLGHESWIRMSTPCGMHFVISSRRDLAKMLRPPANDHLLRFMKMVRVILLYDLSSGYRASEK